MPARRPFAGVLGTPGGPSADATVLEIDRPSAGALGCAGLTAAFLAAMTVGALVLAFSGAATVHRVLAGAAAVCFVILLVVLIGAWIGTTSRVSALAFDPVGLWWTDRDGLVCLHWTEFGSATVFSGNGPKRGRSGQPTLELLPNDVQRLAEHQALREKLTAAESEGAEELRLRLSFALPGEPARRTAEEAIHRFAPQLVR